VHRDQFKIVKVARAMGSSPEKEKQRNTGKNQSGRPPSEKGGHKKLESVKPEQKTKANAKTHQYPGKHHRDKPPPKRKTPKTPNT